MMIIFVRKYPQIVRISEWMRRDARSATMATHWMIIINASSTIMNTSLILTAGNSSTTTAPSVRVGSILTPSISARKYPRNAKNSTKNKMNVMNAMKDISSTPTINVSRI